MKIHRCPHCRVDMAKTEFDGRLVHSTTGAPVRVTMDQCPRCNGVWFDQHEAELTMGLQGSLAALGSAPALPYCTHCGQPAPAGKMTCPSCQKVLARTCPPCGGPMVGLLLFGVHVDRCPKCSGLWFDGGELQAVHEAAKATALAFGGDATYARCGECNTVIDLRSRPQGAPAQRCARCHCPPSATATKPARRGTSVDAADVVDVGLGVLDLLSRFS